MKPARLTFALVGASALSIAVPAAAGEFDPLGNFQFDPHAAATESFESSPVLDDAGASGLTVQQADDALEAGSYALLAPPDAYDAIRIDLVMPAKQASYRMRLWLRRGSATAVFVVNYRNHPARRVLAELSATGRCTSDGWVELESAAVSIDGPDAERAYVSVFGPTEIDAIELVEAGVYQAPVSCEGAFDSACGSQAVCLDGVCRQGDAFVPLLPPEAEREHVVDLIESRFRFFFGGHLTRREHLPEALAEIERMRSAATAWEFWNGLATAVRKLHDWHTRAGGLIQSVRSIAG